MEKPHAPSCERNRDVILAVLRDHLTEHASVLEIGSGTGQHAVHFAQALPAVRWQCSERAEALHGLSLWLDEAARPNLPPSLELDVGAPCWPRVCAGARFEAVFTANTLHIMGWSQVTALFAGLPDVLAPGGRLIVYGPFNRGVQFTSDSNAAFDRWLQGVDPVRGIRDAEAVDELARRAGLALIEDRDMPSHNACRVWRRD